MRYLSRADTERLDLRMSEVLPVVEEAFRAIAAGRSVVAPRTRLLHPPLAAGDRGEGRPWERDLRIIPGGIEGVGMAVRLGASRVSDTSRAAAAELLALFDWGTMELAALISDHVVHAIRTTAADGIFAKHLARSDADTLALLGTGRLARWAAEAVSAGRPLREIRLWSPTAAHREEAAAYLRARLGVAVITTASAEEAVRDAAIAVAATTSPKPVLQAKWIAPGATVISNRPEELDATIYALGRIVTTYADGVRTHVPPYRGLPEDAALVELAGVIAGSAAGRRNQREILVCLNPAYGVLDAVVADLVHRHAVAAGVGTELAP